MGKIIMFNMVTLDGFFAGPNEEIDWHRVDDEFNEFAIAQLNTVSGLLFGRMTYELMASYWPTDMAKRDDPIVANKMNTLPKIVFSRSLDRADWNNTRLVKGSVTEEIASLRQQPGQDWFLFGSADLASTLTHFDLFDEYRVMVNPVILGKGKPLFKDVEDRLNLKLVSAKTFRNGNVLLTYQPDRSEH